MTSTSLPLAQRCAQKWDYIVEGQSSDTETDFVQLAMVIDKAGSNTSWQTKTTIKSQDFVDWCMATWKPNS